MNWFTWNEWRKNAHIYITAKAIEKPSRISTKSERFIVINMKVCHLVLLVVGHVHTIKCEKLNLQKCKHQCAHTNTNERIFSK